ncbi:unnamed protein product [Cyprideis torosa]|uniref:Uncharacterized protein n=1 Tax=Cyprideis torosa TaxID=163714 RepID=A0A7R8WXA0_9CRUS|nr:unnamed protein product [Cyprideis torosa]CAG0911088.1 unnamed protein product [Cyprideis torosa]
MTQPIILASTSQIRHDLLVQAGIRLETVAARIDEQALRAAFAEESISPRDQADLLAEQKARKVSGRRGEALVLGADQILEFEGESFAKPENREHLKRQLTRLSDTRHSLHSAAVIFEAGRPVWRHVETVRMTMRRLSEPYIDRYIDRNWEQVRHCVGGYQIEAEGVRLFSRIDGSYHAVLGLPLVEVLSYLVDRDMVET